MLTVTCHIINLTIVSGIVNGLMMEFYLNGQQVAHFPQNALGLGDGQRGAGSQLRTIICTYTHTQTHYMHIYTHTDPPYAHLHPQTHTCIHTHTPTHHWVTEDPLSREGGQGDSAAHYLALGPHTYSRPIRAFSLTILSYVMGKLTVTCVKKLQQKQHQNISIHMKVRAISTCFETSFEPILIVKVTEFCGLNSLQLLQDKAHDLQTDL